MNKLNWVQGNKLKLSIPLTIVNMDNGEPAPYNPKGGDKVRVFLRSMLRSYEYQPIIENNTLHIEDNGQLEIGTYSVETSVQSIIDWKKSLPNKPMEIFENKYYTQDGVLYLCIRDSGIALTHNLKDLVGIYVEA